MKIRIGMHTGPCVAGVVGTRMPRFTSLEFTLLHSCISFVNATSRLPLRSPTFIKGKPQLTFTVCTDTLIHYDFDKNLTQGIVCLGTQ